MVAAVCTAAGIHEWYGEDVKLGDARLRTDIGLWGTEIRTRGGIRRAVQIMKVFVHGGMQSYGLLFLLRNLNASPKMPQP